MLYPPQGSADDTFRIWTDSAWVGDVTSRKKCSVSIVCHRCKTLAHVALSSGKAGLNSAVKGISEGIGVCNAAKELFREEQNMIPCHPELAPTTLRILLLILWERWN